MENSIIKSGDTEIEKQQFHQYKKTYFNKKYKY